MAKKSTSTQRSRDTRRRLLEMYGSVCELCSYSDIRALDLDHRSGGGTLDRKARRPSQLYRDLVSGKEDKCRFRLLCANCNRIVHLNKRCPKAYSG